MGKTQTAGTLSAEQERQKIRKEKDSDLLRWLILAGVLSALVVIFGASLIPELDCRMAETVTITGSTGGASCPVDRAKATADARSALAQLMLAAGTAATLFFTWRNYRRTWADSARTQELAREGRTSDNFIKAVEQLGNEKTAVRVGGIFGLGRLLRTAKLDGDYWPLMDVITAFTRGSFPNGEKPRVDRRPQDLQAAIDVLARRSLGFEPRTGDSPVDLHYTDLSGLWLASGGHFEDAHLAGCYLVGADLRGSNFQRADLSEADLSYALLEGANLSEANLSGVNLSGVNLEMTELRPGQLNLAIGDAKTKLHSTYPRPNNWPAYCPDDET